VAQALRSLPESAQFEAPFATLGIPWLRRSVRTCFQGARGAFTEGLPEQPIAGTLEPLRARLCARLEARGRWKTPEVTSL